MPVKKLGDMLGGDKRPTTPAASSAVRAAAAASKTPAKKAAAGTPPDGRKGTGSRKPAGPPDGNPHKKTAAQLDEALALLDHELAGLKMGQPMKIRAIGGYALMKHGIRAEERAFTLDIDTVTKDYDAQIKQAIVTVAQQLDLDHDWINNDNVLDNDPAHVEAMIQAEWVPQVTGFAHIDMAIASVPTLTRAKIIAANDAEFSGRAQDMPDLRELLKHQGIDSVEKFLREYPDQFGENENVTRALAEHFGQQDRIESFLSKADGYGSGFDEFDDLSSDIDDWGTSSADDDWNSSYNTNC